MSWEVVFSRHALKDAKKLTSAGLKTKAQELLAVIAADPFQNPPPYEKLVGRVHFALDPRTVVVERNREIVRRPALAETPVHTGDAIELVHFVGGG